MVQPMKIYDYKPQWEINREKRRESIRWEVVAFGVMYATLVFWFLWGMSA